MDLGGESHEDDSSSFAIAPAGAMSLTDECHHYEALHDVPWDIQKYFSQRYSIFSLYDYGIHFTDDAWFGVTPEPVANQIAHDMSKMSPKKSILIDAFAGAGGNTIAFALSGRWDHIISIEKDAATLACAQWNVETYGIDPDYITWIHGDSFEYLDKLTNSPDEVHPDLNVKADNTVIFASPPWGGPGYRGDQVFDLHTMQPYGLQQLHLAYKSMDHVLYLPRTGDIRQIAKLAPDDHKIEVVQYCMEGASKALAAYIPSKSASSEET